MTPPGRPMKYPYTFSAMLAQFPYKYMLKTNWVFRYYFYGVAATMPIFFYIHRKANSPEALESHRQFLKKQAELEHHH